jgi:hypothetical protein
MSTHFRLSGSQSVRRDPSLLALLRIVLVVVLVIELWPWLVVARPGGRSDVDERLPRKAFAGDPSESITNTMRRAHLSKPEEL